MLWKSKKNDFRKRLTVEIKNEFSWKGAKWEEWRNYSTKAENKRGKVNFWGIDWTKKKIVKIKKRKRK